MSSTTDQSRWLIIADSQVIVRNVLADYLRECGYKIVDAASTDDVLTVLEIGTAKIDAILIDAELEGSINPFALRLIVRQRWPDLVVIMAGNVTSAAQAAGELCDVGPHLQRPYEPQAALAHIQQLMARALR